MQSSIVPPSENVPTGHSRHCPSPVVDPNPGRREQHKLDYSNDLTMLLVTAPAVCSLHVSKPQQKGIAGGTARWYRNFSLWWGPRAAHTTLLYGSLPALHLHSLVGFSLSRPITPARLNSSPYCSGCTATYLPYTCTRWRLRHSRGGTCWMAHLQQTGSRASTRQARAM